MIDSERISCRRRNERVIEPCHYCSNKYKCWTEKPEPFVYTDAELMSKSMGEFSQKKKKLWSFLGL